MLCNFTCLIDTFHQQRVEPEHPVYSTVHNVVPVHAVKAYRGGEYNYSSAQS